jgi:hypothetical protein
METGCPIGSGGPLHDPTPPLDLAQVFLESTDPDLTQALWQDVAAMASRGSSLKRGGRAKVPASRTDSDSGKIGPSTSACDPREHPFERLADSLASQRQLHQAHPEPAWDLYQGHQRDRPECFRPLRHGGAAGQGAESLHTDSQP